MIRGTTPTHTFVLPIDTETLKDVKVTYAQNEQVILEKKGTQCVLEDNTVKVKLSQEDTFLFDCSKTVQIQVRGLTTTGEVLATQVINEIVGTCLDDEVLT